MQVHCRFNIQIPVFQTYKHKFYFTLFEILGEFKSYTASIVGNTIECKTILISSSNFNFGRSLVNNLDTEIKLSDAISSKFAQVNTYTDLKLSNVGNTLIIQRNVKSSSNLRKHGT